MLTPASNSVRRRRLGFTLVELMIVLVTFGLVAGAVVRILVRQQRFYSSATDLMNVRMNLRELAGVMPADLRGISSVGGDIYAMSDTTIDFRLSRGVGVICSIGVGRTTFVVPPTSLASRSGIATWLSSPASGDTAFVYDEGLTSMIADDSWQKVAVTAAVGVGTCPITSGFTSTAAEAAASYTFTVSPALSAGVVNGSVVRFYNRAKYKLFQPTAGGSWYLGYLECPGAVCTTMQAVAGPFQPYSATTSLTGLRFVYRDSTGAVTATKTSVARIDITVRAQTQNKINTPGRPYDYYRDSLVFSVAVRNRS
jgi:prepilin-type N-terminal cleavage/methylation domain-containing protein